MTDFRLPSEISRRLRTPAAACYVGLAPKTLEKFRVVGGGPPFLKLGKAVVYQTDDLDAWAQARRRSSTAKPGSTSEPLTR